MSIPNWLLLGGALGAFTLHLDYPPHAAPFWLLALCCVVLALPVSGMRIALGVVVMVDGLRFSDLYADDWLLSLLCPFAVMVGGGLVLLGLLAGVPALGHRVDEFDGPEEP